MKLPNIDDMVIINDFIKHGYSLTCIGVNEYAYDFVTSLKILEYVKSRNWIVLGGDVYLKNQGSIVATFDNWYYNPVGKLDSEKSISKAIDYLTRYSTIKKNAIYSIVVEPMYLLIRQHWNVRT